MRPARLPSVNAHRRVLLRRVLLLQLMTLCFLFLPSDENIFLLSELRFVFSQTVVKTSSESMMRFGSDTELGGKVYKQTGESCTPTRRCIHSWFWDKVRLKVVTGLKQRMDKQKSIWEPGGCFSCHRLSQLFLTNLHKHTKLQCLVQTAHSHTGTDAVAMVSVCFLLFPLLFWLEGNDLQKICNSFLNLLMLTAPTGWLSVRHITKGSAASLFTTSEYILTHLAFFLRSTSFRLFLIPSPCKAGQTWRGAWWAAGCTNTAGSKTRWLLALPGSVGSKANRMMILNRRRRRSELKWHKLSEQHVLIIHQA